MIVPKVGAMVEFRPANSSGLRSEKKDQWLAAIVCYVFEESRDREAQVNLRVFDENGNGYARTMVTVVPPDDSPAGDSVLSIAGYCRLISCPPIQVKEEEAKAPKNAGVIETKSKAEKAGGKAEAS